MRFFEFGQLCDSLFVVFSGGLELVIALFRHSVSSIYYYFRGKKALILAFFWLSGALFGVRFAYCIEDLPNLVFSVTQQKPTLWNAVWSCCYPVLLTAFAARYSKAFVLGIVFFCSFRFAFSALAVLLTYGAGGWLVQLLFLSSDYLLIPWYYILWLRIFMNQGHLNSWLAFCFFLSVLAGLLQFRIISPFLCGLF